MRKISRVILSGVTATALGFGTLPGAMAQDEGDQGMDASSSASILESLATADEGLNGPVKVKRNGEELTVTYTNETESEQKCSGLVLPYSEVVKEGLDKADPETTDGLELLRKFNSIVDRGDSAVLNYESKDGAQVPTARSGADAVGKGLEGAAGATTSAFLNPTPAGEAVTWTASNPEKDAVAIILCDGVLGSGVKNYRGIEQSIFFGEVKDKLGPVGSVVDGSSESPALAGSITRSIPGLASIIDFFSGLMKNLKSFFDSLFGAKGSSLPGSSKKDDAGEGTQSTGGTEEGGNA